MTDGDNKTETPFWRFSLQFYRQPGVSDACIALQDECGVDVNLLLFLFWLASDAQSLTMEEVRKLDDRVRSWRELTIVPIREVRRKLKGAPTLVEPAQQEAFRNKVKAIELDAEKLQQAALYAFTQSGPLGTRAALADAARNNVAAYQRIIGGNGFPQRARELLIAAFDSITRGSTAAAREQ